MITVFNWIVIEEWSVVDRWWTEFPTRIDFRVVEVGGRTVTFKKQRGVRDQVWRIVHERR